MKKGIPRKSAAWSIRLLPKIKEVFERSIKTNAFSKNRITQTAIHHYLGMSFADRLKANRAFDKFMESL